MKNGIRGALIMKTHPLFSGGVELVKVSLACEPWNKPEPRREQKIEVEKADPEKLVIKAIASGKTKFFDICMQAFGSHSGYTERKCRSVLRALKQRGVVQSSQIPGKPMIWALCN